MRIVSTGERSFAGALKRILQRGESDTSKVEESVKSILAGVKKRGDRALLGYTRKFDGVALDGVDCLEIKRAEIDKTLDGIPADDVRILKKAARRIRDFHRKQLPKSWSMKESTSIYLA